MSRGSPMPEDTFEDIRQRLFDAAWDAPAYPPAPERTVARARRRAATTIAGAALAVALAIVVAASVLPFDPRQQQVGTTTQPDDREFLVDIRTGRTTEVTTNPMFERAWWQNVSPDGRRIAFTSDRSGSLQLFVADIDGSNVRQLKLGLGVRDVYEPVWSPDGGRIAFGALDLSHGVTRNLYVIDLTTGGVRRITNESKDPWSPEWSPDGESILYSVITDGRSSEVAGYYPARTRSGQLRVVDLRTRRIHPVFGGPKVLAGDATW